MKNENFIYEKFRLVQSNFESCKSDKDLHKTFVRLGNNRRLLANQLLAMLPEIFERGIYKKYARTIEEYAAKFGGLSGSVVRKRLRLEKYVKDKPNLREAIATEGVHKVALVASLATVETEAAWADKVRNMSKPAVQELSKEVRWKMEKGEIGLDGCVNQNLFEERFNSENYDGVNFKTTFCGVAPQQIKINLEGDLFFMFLKLKKKYGENLTNQEVMKKIFEENLGRNFCKKFQDAERESAEDGVQKIGKLEKLRKMESAKNAHLQSVKVIPGDTFVRNKFRVAEEKCGKKEVRNEVQNEVGFKKKSRYSSVYLRRNLLQKTAGRCSYPECQRPAEIFHHTNRFANSQSHESLKPMCKIHHEFAHNGLVQNEKMRRVNGDWKCEMESWIKSIGSIANIEK